MFSTRCYLLGDSDPAREFGEAPESTILVVNDLKQSGSLDQFAILNRLLTSLIIHLVKG